MLGRICVAIFQMVVKNMERRGHAHTNSIQCQTLNLIVFQNVKKIKS